MQCLQNKYFSTSKETFSSGSNSIDSLIYLSLRNKHISQNVNVFL